VTNSKKKASRPQARQEDGAGRGMREYLFLKVLENKKTIKVKKEGWRK